MKFAVTLLTLSLNVGLALTVLGLVLSARPDHDLRFLAREWRLMVRSLVSIFVLAPAVALVVVTYLHMPLRVKVAIVALSFSIIPPYLPRREIAAGGDRSYAVVLTVTVGVLAMGLVPALADLFGRLTAHRYGVPPGQIAEYVATIFIVPLAAGLAGRRLRPAAAQAAAAPVSRVAFVLTVAVMAVNLVVTFPKLVGLISPGTIVAMLLFSVGALAAGAIMGGPEPEREIVLALASATRHPAIAITIATINYPAEKVAAAVTLSLIINTLVSTSYVRLRQRRNGGASGPPQWAAPQPARLPSQSCARTS